MRYFITTLCLVVLRVSAAAQCPPQWVEVGAPLNGSVEMNQTPLDYDQVRGRLVAHYGSQTVEWDGASWLVRATSIPSVRYQSMGTYCRGIGEFQLFGGGSSTGGYPTLWAWNGQSWTLRSSNGPGRYQHAQAFDENRSALVVFGGFIADNKIGGDTWEYKAGAWVLRSESGPSPRTYHRMAFDSDRRVVVLYGGYTQFGTRPNDTWEWDGTAWSLREAASAPGDRTGHAMVYHRSRQRVWLIGGDTNNGFQQPRDVWEWDGNTWTVLPATGLLPVRGHSAAYVDSDASVLVVGGDRPGGGQQRTVQRIVVPAVPAITAHPIPATVCVGGPLSLSVTVSGTGPYTYVWRRNSQPVAGQSQATLTIPQCAYSDAGLYDCVVSNSCGQDMSGGATVGVLPDLRPSGTIDTADLTLFLLFFGYEGQTTADINGDGVVNTGDLPRFLSSFGQTCGQ